MKQDSQVQPNFTPIISCYNIIEERLRRIDYSNWLTNWLKSIGLHMELHYLISLKRLTNYLDVPASLLSKLDKQQATVDKQ